MKLGVKRSILTKFHKFLKLPSILNKFQMDSTPSLHPWIVIQITFRVRASSNNQSCYTLQIISPSILFQNFWAQEASIQPNQIQAVFNFWIPEFIFGLAHLSAVLPPSSTANWPHLPPGPTYHPLFLYPLCALAHPSVVVTPLSLTALL
jgi:hypothetical protein